MTAPRTQQSTAPRGRTSTPVPLWRRLIVAGVLVLVAGYGLTLMNWGETFPGLDGLFDRLLPYSWALAAVLIGLGLVVLLIQRQFGTTPNETSRAPVAIARTAIASELRINPERVHVRIRRTRLLRRLRDVRIRLRPRGAFTEDPMPKLGVTLSPVLGQLKKHSWDARRAEGWLVPGAPETAEKEVPEAATTPVERATQILAPVVKSHRTEIVKTANDGSPTEFLLYHPTNLKLANGENQEGIRSRIGQMMPTSPHGHGWGADIQVQNDRIRVYERPAIPTRVLHPVIDYTTEFGQGVRFLPCATGADDALAGWDISRSTQKPHGLVAGETGGGKTNIILTLALGASRLGARDQDLAIWGLDPKQIELMALEGLPGVTQLAYTVEQMASLIDAAYQEMEDRYSRVRNRELHPNQLPPLVIFLDEFLILVSMLNRWWKQKGGRGEAPQIGELVNLLALSRSAGIYICVGVQRPDATLFKDGARDNLKFRASTGALSPQGADMMWNDRTIGTTEPPYRGRGTVTGPDGKPMEGQLWYTPSLDQHPMYRNEMTQEERDRIDTLRPADYTPRSLTADDLWLPDSVERQQDGGFEDEMRDVSEVLRMKQLSPGDRIKLEDDDAQMIPATVEHVDHEDDRGRVTLDFLWEGGSPEQQDFDENEQVWHLG